MTYTTVFQYLQVNDHPMDMHDHFITAEDLLMRRGSGSMARKGRSTVAQTFFRVSILLNIFHLYLFYFYST